MKKAFTLVELVLVLALLALVTHLGVRSLSPVFDSRLEARADAQLEALRAAVLTVGADGDLSGFLADMGRLPRADGLLRELWAPPDVRARYGVRPALATNLVVDAAFAGADEPTLADASVYVPTGWRGPYAALPAGKSALLDPWGNAFVPVDEAGFERVGVSNAFAVAVSHYGREARASSRRTRSLVPDGGASSRLVVRPVSREGATQDVWLKWYGPASGLITGAVARVAVGSVHVFEGLSPGLRIVKAGPVVRHVRVRPGDNLVEIVLP